MRLLHRAKDGFETLIPEDEQTEKIMQVTGGSAMAIATMKDMGAVFMAPEGEYQIVDDDYTVCEFCGNTREIVTSEQVYPGEPHMADIGTRVCSCAKDQHDDDRQD